MATSIFSFMRRHRRPLSAAVVALVLIGIVASVLQWQAGGGPPPEVITTLTDQCRTEPARPSAPPNTNYWHTCGARIYDSHGELIQIVGVSWFGFETANKAPSGLWARNWQTILDQLRVLGYNTIRLPYSNDIFLPGAQPTGINYLLNPDLQGMSSLDVMDKLIAGARERNLRVLLDRHRPTSAGQTDLWYTATVPESTWIADWTDLARRYQDNDTVIGADISNEPRGPATWGSNDIATDWRLAAQRGGNAILAVNPRWLIFVEGVQQYSKDWYWWGGNLMGVASAPVSLAIANRVVYSPHDYGPEVYPQGWFSDPTYPNNLPSVWDAHWAYIARQNIAPVVLGEFGGRSLGADAEGTWQRSLVAFVRQRHLGFISWALNPESGDTGGILQDDWLTVQSGKHDLYSTGASRPANAQPVSSVGPPVRLQYHAASGSSPASNVAFVVTLFNGGGDPIPLSHLTLRYWFAENPKAIQPIVDWATIGESHIKLKVVPQSCGTQAGYIEAGFDEGSSPLAGYGTTGPILVRYHLSNWGLIDPTKDRGFGPSSADAPWPKIQVFRDGSLIWGDALSC